MIRRTSAKVWSLGSALVLLIVGACSTDSDSNGNGSTSTSGGANTSPDASVGSEGGSGGTGGDTGGTGGAAADTGGAGGAFSVIYAMRCPDQPADLFEDRGPGQAIEAGDEADSTPTRPQLSAAEADELYSIEEALMGGGVFTVTYSGAGGEGSEAGGTEGDAGVTDAGAAGGGGGGGPLGEPSVEYESGPWDPVSELEDVSKIVPGLIVDPDGNGTNDTIQSAISDAVVVEGCPTVYIQVKPGTYRERIIVPAKTSSPPLVLYSTDSDPSNTVIVYGNAAAGAEVDGTLLDISDSATFTQSLPQPFQARNLTIANDYVEGTYEGEQAAVALLNQGDRARYENVRFLGNRHTVYVKSTAVNQVSRTYFRDCYIEGDEEYVLGRGAAVFDQCEIHSLGDRVSTGAIAAPSTRLTNPHGMLFINSEFTADDGVSDVYLGRPWFEGDNEEAIGKVIVRNSLLDPHIRSEDPWAAIERVTPKDPEATEPMVLYTSDDYYAPMTGIEPIEVYLAEFGNSGPGAAQ